MYQTSFKFYDINPEQIPLPLDYTKCEYSVTYGHVDIPYGTIMNSIDSAISLGNSNMNSYINVNKKSYMTTKITDPKMEPYYIGKDTYCYNSYINVNNPDGGVMARMDDTGLSIKMENQSWLKTKMANWLGIKYL